MKKVRQICPLGHQERLALGGCIGGQPSVAEAGGGPQPTRMFMGIEPNGARMFMTIEPSG